MATHPTPHIPDHELLRCIGKGSYGEVWLARSVTGTFRAVKIVYRNSFDHERPYEREFAGIQKFEPVSRTHETQVGILHVGRNDADGHFYYMMELADDQVTGQDINPDSYKPWSLRSDLYQKGRLPIQECLDIGLHLAAALDHIHKNGLVHRDVKPSNVIFINRVPKLADIGLVTSSDATRSFVGTEGYIPPEGPGSPQADIYSLGKVLYEISTGRNRLDFPELPTLLKDSPEKEALVQFNELVLKACEEDPKRRYQTAEEMLTDLWTLKSGKPLRRIRPKSGVRKLLIATLVAGVLVSSFCLGYWWIKSRQPPPQPKSAATINTSSTERPVAWWKGDGNALDSAGTNNGILMNGTSFGDGKGRQAFTFDGGASGILIPDSPIFRFDSSFSITLWMKVPGYVNRLSAIITKGDHSWRLQRDFNGHSVLFSISGVQHKSFKGYPPVDLPATTVVDDGQWHHIAVVYSGSSEFIYIDGKLDVSTPCTGEPDINTDPVMIGNSLAKGRSLNGCMEDVRVYKRVLSGGEVQMLFKSRHEVLVPQSAQAPSDSMALIPAGSFTMGDTLDGSRSATPTVVTVSAFYMDVNLVSYGQWQSVYNWAMSHGYGFVHVGAGKGANHPVQTVDWYDCVKWCNARSQQAGLTPVYYTDAGLAQVYTNGEVTPYVNWTASGYRLPTEAEWEKAARGGLSGQRFPWGNTISWNEANCFGGTNSNSYYFGPAGWNPSFTTGGAPFTSPVGYFAPNGYGLYDMAGNVLEWCWDWYGTPYAGETNPHGPPPRNNRVLRGGSWRNTFAERCAWRASENPGIAGNGVGFRCVRGL